MTGQTYAMTPDEMKACRMATGLPLAEWAIALGYRSISRGNLRTQAYTLESGRRQITESCARLAMMLAKHGVPEEFLQPLPAPEEVRWTPEEIAMAKRRAAALLTDGWWDEPHITTLDVSPRQP